MSSGSSGLGTKHGPALDLPGRFMLLGMVMLAAVAVVSPLAYPLLLESFYAPRLLAFVHLNTLGVVAAVLMGASYQLVPVVLQTPLASVRLGRVSFWLYLFGIAFFLPALLETWRPGVSAGASLIVAGLVLYLLLVARTLCRASRLDVVSWHIVVALVGLAGGMSAGLLLAVNKGAGFLADATFRILAAHAVLMIAGWVIVMLNGVAYRLVGMFTLSEDRIWHRVAWAELAFTATGAWTLAIALVADAPRSLLGAGAIAIVGGQALFGAQLVHLYRVRRRRGFDIHLPYALTAVACGMLAALLLAGGILSNQPIDANVWIAVGWLAISGVAITAIQGFFYKIATFLVWLHRYAPLAGRTRVPRLEDLYDRQIAKAGWILWASALAGSTAAIFLSNQLLARAAGVAALAGLGCFLVNAARIASHVRSTATVQYRHANQAHVPGMGKEGHRS